LAGTCIRHDNSGLAAGWHLHKLLVHNKTHGWQVRVCVS
jgi:hypothetical protein